MIQFISAHFWWFLFFTSPALMAGAVLGFSSALGVSYRLALKPLVVLAMVWIAFMGGGWLGWISGSITTANSMAAKLPVDNWTKELRKKQPGETR